MNRRNRSFGAVTIAAAIASGFLMVATAGYATENAQERRNARDTKQDSREGARKEKVDCRQANHVVVAVTLARRSHGRSFGLPRSSSAL